MLNPCGRGSDLNGDFEGEALYEESEDSFSSGDSDENVSKADSDESMNIPADLGDARLVNDSVKATKLFEEPEGRSKIPSCT